MPLYFILRPQLSQLVPRHPFTKHVRLFFAVQHPVIQPVLVSNCNYSLSSKLCRVPCMLTEPSVSLFSILLLSSLHNIVYTHFLRFSFLRTGFCNPAPDLLFVRLTHFVLFCCFIHRRSHPRLVMFDLLIVFNSASLVLLFLSTILLLFVYSACSLSILIQ